MDPSHSSALNSDQIMAIHKSSGHPGVRRTTYFVRRTFPASPRGDVKMAIGTCEECQSIDPAPVHWEKGTLEVDDNWQRLGMDITHYGAHYFPTLPDCGPSRLAIGETRLCQRDSPHGYAVFWAWTTTRTPYR